MIANDQQLQATLERTAWFQKQVAQLGKTETNPANYRAAASGFLTEIDRMQLEVREYFSFLLIKSGRSYPLCSPDRAFSAAAALLQALKEERTQL
jgi:hypothetical protein